MFSSSSRSWSRIVLALGITALGLSSLLLTSGTAVAYEGVQGKYAIFYPAVELLYFHTDNLYLTPDDTTSSDSFIARVPLRLEVPTDRHYFMFQWTPQFRDIDNFDLDDQWSHFVDLKGVFQGSPTFRFEVEDNFTRGVLEVEDVDRDGELLLGVDPFYSNLLKLDFIWEARRQGADLYLGWFKTEFDRKKPTDDNARPGFLDQDRIIAGIEYFYKFTPLSRFEVGYDYSDVESTYYDDIVTEPINDLCIGGRCLGYDTISSKSSHLYVGFSGELGRTTTGEIKLGYRATDYDVDDASDYNSLVVAGTFTKAFTRFTKLEVNLHRQENLSNFENNAYYTANRIGLALTNQPLGRRVFWSVAGGFQQNSYPDPVEVNNDNIHRKDDILMARAEIGYYPLTYLNVKLNYRYEDRNANIPDGSFDYTENAFFFQIGIGY
jgi:hypothetical protein